MIVPGNFKFVVICGDWHGVLSLNRWLSLLAFPIIRFAYQEVFRSLKGQVFGLRHGCVDFIEGKNLVCFLRHKRRRPWLQQVQSNQLALAVAFEAAILLCGCLASLSRTDIEVLRAWSDCSVIYRATSSINLITISKIEHATHRPGDFFFLLFLCFILSKRKPLASFDDAHEAEVLHKLECWLGHLQFFHLTLSLLPSFNLAWTFTNLFQVELTGVC